MAVSKRAKHLYDAFFDGIETGAANMILTVQEHQYLRRYTDPQARLSRDQIEMIRQFWAPYCRVSPKWALYYSSRNGRFDPRYVPNTLYYKRIDQHFNARKLGYGFNDKNYYARIFPDVMQPETVVRNIGGLFFDDRYSLISFDEAVGRICYQPEIIVKPSQESGSGRGIRFLKPADDAQAVRAILQDQTDSNYIVQTIAQQHPALERVHEGSLNTIRVCSLLLDDGVHILSSVLRMGVNESRIDNVTAGGISAAILPGGVLDKYAYTYYSGERFEQHPQGLVFEGYPVPSFDRVIETVKHLAQSIGNFRLVSWDMGVDKDGNVLLIEANMRKGGINLHQFDNGPIFGDLTERVLDEVFGKRQPR